MGVKTCRSFIRAIDGYPVQPSVPTIFLSWLRKLENRDTNKNFWCSQRSKSWDVKQAYWWIIKRVKESKMTWFITKTHWSESKSIHPSTNYNFTVSSCLGNEYKLQMFSFSANSLCASLGCEFSCRSSLEVHFTWLPLPRYLINSPTQQLTLLISFLISSSARVAPAIAQSARRCPTIRALA